MDPATGKPHVLVSRAKLAALSGANATETDRDHRDRYKMASYLWAPDSAHLMFDSNGRLWIYDLKNGTGVEIGFTGAASGDDPKFSPNGESISFVRDHGLAVVRLEGCQRPGDRGGARAKPDHPERRGGLDLPGRTGGAQQLLLVAGLEEPGLSADERDGCAAVSHQRLDSDPRQGG